MNNLIFYNLKIFFNCKLYTLIYDIDKLIYSFNIQNCSSNIYVSLENIYFAETQIKQGNSYLLSITTDKSKTYLHFIGMINYLPIFSTISYKNIIEKRDYTLIRVEEIISSNSFNGTLISYNNTGGIDGKFFTLFVFDNPCLCNNNQPNWLCENSSCYEFDDICSNCKSNQICVFDKNLQRKICKDIYPCSQCQENFVCVSYLDGSSSCIEMKGETINKKLKNSKILNFVFLILIVFLVMILFFSFIFGPLNLADEIFDILELQSLS